ncbi:MAG: hypothetical protein U0939_24350 [Pirellulales bacterium]
MGQLRFIVPRGERLDEAAVQRAYLGGMDHVPWPTTTEWDGKTLIVEREVRESGTLSIPWTVAGHGELVLTTSSLMERKAPYLLPLELARGTVHRLRAQLAAWQLIGYRPSDAVREQVSDAQESFMRAAMEQGTPEAMCDDADRTLEYALTAIESACSEFAQASLRSRQSQTPTLNTLLGAVVESPPLDAKSAKWTLASFNAAQLRLTWSETEQEQGIRSFAAAENQLQWCREHQLKVLAGPLFRPSRRSWPTWIDPRGNFETTHRQLLEYTEDVVRYFQGRVHVWHAVSAVAGDNETRLSEEQRLRLAVSVIETVRRLDPRTPIVVSFDQPWGEYMTRRHFDLSPMHFADMLVRSDLGVAGLGMEINFGYDSRATWPRDLLEFNRQIDHWSTLGLPLLLFLSAPSAPGLDAYASEPASPNSRVGPLGPSQEWQKRFVEQAVPFLISKPAVHSVFWNQLRDEVPHDFAHGGLFDIHGARKPAIESLADFRQKHLT